MENFSVLSCDYVIYINCRFIDEALVYLTKTKFDQNIIVII